MADAQLREGRLELLEKMASLSEKHYLSEPAPPGEWNSTRLRDVQVKIRRLGKKEMLEDVHEAYAERVGARFHKLARRIAGRGIGLRQDGQRAEGRDGEVLQDHEDVRQQEEAHAVNPVEVRTLEGRDALGIPRAEVGYSYGASSRLLHGKGASGLAQQTDGVSESAIA